MAQPRRSARAATPRASATSCPCAQVSISRAVAMVAAPIGGPNHGSLPPGRDFAERHDEVVAGSTPARQQLGGLHLRAALGFLIDEVQAAFLHGARQHGVELVGVPRGERRDAVGPGQVGDLVRDGPARRRGFGTPGAGVRRGQQSVQHAASAARSTSRSSSTAIAPPGGRSLRASCGEPFRRARKNQSCTLDFSPDVRGCLEAWSARGLTSRVRAGGRRRCRSGGRPRG